MPSRNTLPSHNPHLKQEENACVRTYVHGWVDFEREREREIEKYYCCTDVLRTYLLRSCNICSMHAYLSLAS